MNENPKCIGCELHRTAHHRCLPGRGSVVNARLMVLLGAPGYIEERTGKGMSGDAVSLVDYMFRRMSISPDDYYLEYVVKCYPNKGKLPGKMGPRRECIAACSQYRDETLTVLHPATIVGLGTLPCEYLVGGTKIGEWSDSWWKPTNPLVASISPVIWIGPNPVAVLMSPTQCPDLYRVLWKAAEYAGLSPAFDKSVPMFDWSNFIK